MSRTGRPPQADPPSSLVDGEARGAVQDAVGVRSVGMMVTSRNFIKNSAKFCSFSAVSAPNFANKYAFFSIFKNLQDYLVDILKLCKIDRFNGLYKICKLLS